MEGRATNFLQVVERQCRRWELQQAERRARAPVHWPVITVSREFGARGEALARLVALRTGFSFWDVELIHALAAESGASEAILRSLDEHRRNALEDSIEGALMGGQYMNSEFVRGLMRLIHTIASHGAGIIVGRGAQYVLAEPALRVRVVCPLGERIRGYASRRGLDELAPAGKWSAKIRSVAPSSDSISPATLPILPATTSLSIPGRLRSSGLGT